MKTAGLADKALVKRCFVVFVVTVIGTLLYAIGMNAFFVPHHFLAGGLAGIAMIIYYLTGFPIGTMNLLLNVPLLLLSLRYMGKFYTAVSILGTVTLSFFIDATAFLSQSIIIHSPLVSAITGGFIIGVGTGILYRYNTNSGGLDIVGAILKKYYNLEIGNVVFALNVLIVGASAAIFSLERAVCTLIGMYLTANVANRVVIGTAQRKAAFIVSRKPLEITDGILREIGHGATLLDGQGGFSGARKQIVFAIIDLTQIAKLRQLIHVIDPHAFLFIMNTTDVIGQGFTTPVAIPTGKNLQHAARYVINEEGELVPTKFWQYEMDQETHPTPAPDKESYPEIREDDK